MSARGGSLAMVAGCVATYVARDRVRPLFRSAFARRRGRLVVTRSAAELNRVVRRELIDAVVVDVGAPSDETWAAAELARELPGVPFFSYGPLGPDDAPVLARCAALGFADLLADPIDDAALDALVAPHRFSARFARALSEPPCVLRLTTPLQLRAWRYVVAHAGRAVSTADAAAEARVTREHLSRSFTAGGAPNLKRVMDLVRVIAAAELAKNPGYAVGDVATILGFASSSHLASTAQRVVGTRPRSLARLRTVDLLERFTTLVEARGREAGGA
jgi:AraC-like DNA-binding protein